MGIQLGKPVGLVLVCGDGIILGSTDYEPLCFTTLGAADRKTIWIVGGNDLVNPYSSFDGSNEGKPVGLLLG